LDVAGRCGQKPVTAAVAVSAPLSRALMAIGTDGSSGLGLDQGLLGNLWTKGFERQQ